MNRRNLFKAAIGGVVLYSLPTATLARENDKPIMVAYRHWGLEYMADSTWNLNSEVRLFASLLDADKAFKELEKNPVLMMGHDILEDLGEVVGEDLREFVEAGDDTSSIYIIDYFGFTYRVVAARKDRMVFLYCIQAEDRKDREDCYEVISDSIWSYQYRQEWTPQDMLDLLPDEEDAESLGLDQLNDEGVFAPRN